MKSLYFMPLVLSAALSAQTPSGIPSQPKAPAQKTVPALTELEATKLKLLITQNMLLRQQEQELQAQYQAEVKLINDSHPGFAFNEQTQSLVPIPTGKTSDPVSDAINKATPKE